MGGDRTFASRRFRYWKRMDTEAPASWERRRVVRFYRGLMVALVVAMALRVATEGTVLERVLGAPLVEEIWKALFLLVLVAVVRGAGGLKGGWGRELHPVLLCAVAVGVITAGLEFFTSYYGEAYFHRFLRFVAHPTYLLVSLTTALWLWHLGRRRAFAWGITAASAVHGLFNGAESIGLVGSSQSFVLVGAVAVLAAAISRMADWREGPREWRALTTLPRRARPRPGGGPTQPDVGGVA